MNGRTRADLEAYGSTPMIHNPLSGTVAFMKARLAKLSDAADIAEIYNHEVLSSVTTFDLVPKSLEEQREWLRDRSGALPCIVATNNDEALIGWACLSKYRDRPAYGTSVEDSIYVHQDHQGIGVGNLLLAELLRLADEHGFHSTFARIAGQNASSIALHTKHGFELVGVEKEVGRKFGQWLDVTLMQRITPRESSFSG
jgi:phosphinothricin acetyltransferase